MIQCAVSTQEEKEEAQEERGQVTMAGGLDNVKPKAESAAKGPNKGKNQWEPQTPVPANPKEPK